MTNLVSGFAEEPAAGSRQADDRSQSPGMMPARCKSESGPLSVLNLEVQLVEYRSHRTKVSALVGWRVGKL